MRKTLQPGDLVASIVGLPTTMDTMRRAEVQQLAASHDHERAALDLERKRLAAKYGAESAQAAAASARLDYLDRARTALAAEVLRETIAVPKVNAGEFVIYGRILTAAGDGVPGATVTAVDSGRCVLASTASVEQGVFEVHVLAAQQSGQPATGLPAALQLEVSVSQILTPFQYDEIFQPAGGRLAYREIVLPASMGQPSTTSFGPSSQPLYTL